MDPESKWCWRGGLAGGVLVYEKGDPRRPELRAYAVAGRGGVQIVGFDGDGSVERQALEAAIERDLRERFAATAIGNAESGDTASLSEVLDVLGVRSSTSVKLNRGRRPRWSDRAELRRFAEGYIERGDRQGLGERQTREVMTRATAAGVVEVVTRVGRRKIYRLLPQAEPQAPPMVPGDRERTQWLQAQRFAAQLEENWKRQVALRRAGALQPPTRPQLSEHPEIHTQFAESDEERCARILCGIRCALRVDHSDGCFIFTRRHRKLPA
jgi:hypothetical protein